MAKKDTSPVGPTGSRIGRLLHRLREPAQTARGSTSHSPFALELGTDASIEAERDLPPVVARMVVEVRSDGTRTVARGALEDIATGQRVAIRADGSSPAALAAALTKSLFKAPSLAKSALGGLLDFGRRSKEPSE